MKRRLRDRAILLLAVTAALAAGAGCERQAATAGDCRAVVDRLVELELRESGYRDPALAARWQRELAARFAPELQRCRGLRVRPGLRACLAAARTSEEVAHRCLD